MPAETATSDMVRRRLEKVCAFWLVAQILLPFTAPFQAYNLSDDGSNDSTSASSSSVDLADTLVASLATATGRLKLAPLPMPSVSNSITASFRVVIASRGAPATRSDCDYSASPTILRL